MSDTAPGIAELAARIPFLLSQLGAHLATDFERRLTPIDIDPRAYAVLLALAERDGQSQRQLSARLGIHRNVMVSVVDTLERKRLARRRPHPDDRRAFAVTLTDKGRDLLPTLDQLGEALEDEITAPLSAAERGTLRSLLQRLSAGAGLIPGVHPGLT